MNTAIDSDYKLVITIVEASYSVGQGRAEPRPEAYLVAAPPPPQVYGVAARSEASAIGVDSTRSRIDSFTNASP